MAIGSFAFVLHGHLPYVLRHGVWPHGEDWLYEAASETYLPILAMLDECEFLNGNPKLTMGLTPVLLEQLTHEHFRKGFEDYLADRVERARADKADFEKLDNGHMIYLAEQWIEWFEKQQQQFADMGRDIPKDYVRQKEAGRLEILTSNATHGYMPLLYEDSSIRAQIRAGLQSSERILGFKPTGMWLPECAYRPQGDWNPPINWGWKGGRIGIEHLVADEGITHFFVENHLIEGSRSEWVDNMGWQKVDWDEGRKYASRGWRRRARAEPGQLRRVQPGARRGVCARPDHLREGLERALRLPRGRRVPRVPQEVGPEAGPAILEGDRRQDRPRRQAPVLPRERAGQDPRARGQLLRQRQERAVRLPQQDRSTRHRHRLLRRRAVRPLVVRGAAVPAGRDAEPQRRPGRGRDHDRAVPR